MRDVFSLLVLLVAGVISALGQSSTQAAPAAKTPVHQAPTHAATGQPTAIIETTVGKMTCILFPDKAPIGVENFIGLATGKKDWTNPASGAKKHGVPAMHIGRTETAVFLIERNGVPLIRTTAPELSRIWRSAFALLLGGDTIEDVIRGVGEEAELIAR